MLHTNYQTMPSNFISTNLPPISQNDFHCSQIQEIEKWSHINKTIGETVGLNDLCISSDKAQKARPFFPRFNEAHLKELSKINKFIIDPTETKKNFTNPCFKEGVHYLRDIFKKVLSIVHVHLYPLKCDETSRKKGNELKRNKENSIQRHSTVSAILNQSCESLDPKYKYESCSKLKIYNVSIPEWRGAIKGLAYRKLCASNGPLVRHRKQRKRLNCTNPIFTQAQAKAMETFLDLFTSNEKIADLINRCRAEKIIFKEKTNAPFCEKPCYTQSLLMLQEIAFAIFEALSAELKSLKNGQTSKLPLIFPKPVGDR